MHIDNLPKEITRETESIKPFNSISGAIAWIENAAQKLGESTTSIKRTKLQKSKMKDEIEIEITEPDNVTLSKLFSEASADILFQRNMRENLPDYPSLKNSPKEGWPLKDTGSEVLMRVVDEAGGEYNVSIVKSIGEIEFSSILNSSISYTTQSGTPLEHTTSVEVDINHQKDQNRVDPETEAKFLEMAAGLRSAINWKVESLVPEMKDELEVDDNPSGFMKKTIGRIAGGSSVKLLYK